MSASTKICILVLFSFCWLPNSHQDITHLFAQRPNFNYYQNPQHHPFVAHQTSHLPVALHSEISTLYEAHSGAVETGGLYPKPVGPSEIAAPAPVAAISSGSELTLPEIVENRSRKDRQNFIPLLKQYLPPDQNVERPNYESPSESNLQYDPLNGGYVYQKPVYVSPTTSTAKPPNAIIMVDPPQFINNDPVILPPLSNENDSKETAGLPAPAQGYIYNPPIPAAADTPFSQPASDYLPPSKDQHQQYSVSQTSDTTVPLRLRVHEMRCLQHQPKATGYLRAVLKVDNFLSATPSVDNDSSDKRCDIKLHKSFLVIDIAGEDFTRCGVQQCGMDLCLRLRFPAIRGMRTGGDNILTLHCKSQNRVAVKTHAVKMGVANDVQARSIGTYAKGGTQNSFRTYVELLKKTPQGYARLLKANEAVQLGEELLLRAHVLLGDGWNYTKLTDVSLQRISPSGEMLNNVQLITTQGCLNPSMKGICTQAPTFDAPLGYKLAFKAVMFQGMRSGEELIMTLRITGCLEQHDCYVNIEQCNNYSAANLKRRRREMLDIATHNNSEISEISRVSFRVIMPEETISAADFPTDSFKTQTKPLILFCSLGFVALLMCLGIFVLIKFRKY